MTQVKFHNPIELNKILYPDIKKALKMTRDEIWEVIQKYIDSYYNEPVFKNGKNTPDIYSRTNKFAESLIKTDVIFIGNTLSCKVEISKDYLDYDYPSLGTFDATGYEVATWANSKSHGGMVRGNIEFWNDALKELGWEAGTMERMKNNLKKCKVPVI